VFLGAAEDGGGGAPPPAPFPPPNIRLNMPAARPLDASRGPGENSS
jgi:hypothetical protein